MKRRSLISIFLLILLTGMLLRIYKLGSHDLWYDEVASIFMARFPGEIVFDQQPPLYYMLLDLWMRFVGTNEFILRFLSVFFSTLSIIMIYQLGKSLFDSNVGIIAALLFSISPIHIWYAQEVKGYTLLPLLIVTTFYSFILAIKHNKKFLWFVFILFSIFSIYTAYISFFILMSEGLFFIFNRKYRYLSKRWVISLLIILISFLPWLRIFMNQTVNLLNCFWIPKPIWGSMIITFENFNVGYSATNLIYFISLVLFTPLFIYGFFYCYRKKELMIMILLLLFIFVPILFIFLISQWLPIYIDRQIICLSCFYYIIVSVGIMGIRNRFIKGGILTAIILIISLSLFNYYSDRLTSNLDYRMGVHIKKPFKPIFKYIKENFEKGDIIVHCHFSTIAPLWYYYDRMAMDKQYYFATILSGPNVINDIYWQKFAKFAKEKEGKKIRIIDLGEGKNILKENNFKRVWVISSSWSRNGELDQNSDIVRTWMMKYYSKINSKVFEGILVEVYARNLYRQK